jgi:hypothetical protein
MTTKIKALLGVAAIAIIISTTNSRSAQAFAGIDTAAIVAAIKAAQDWLTEQILGGFDFSSLVNKIGFDNLQKAATRQIGVEVEIADANNKIAQAARQQEHQIDTIMQTMPTDTVCQDMESAGSIINATNEYRDAAIVASRSATLGMLGKNGDPRRLGTAGAVSQATKLEQEYGNLNPQDTPLADVHRSPEFIFDTRTRAVVKDVEQATQLCSKYAFNAVQPFLPPTVRTSDLEKEQIRNSEAVNNVRRNAALTANKMIMDMCMAELAPVGSDKISMMDTLRQQADGLKSPQRLEEMSVATESQAVKEVARLNGMMLDFQLRLLEANNRNTLLLAQILSSLERSQPNAQ